MLRPPSNLPATSLESLLQPPHLNPSVSHFFTPRFFEEHPERFPRRVSASRIPQPLSHQHFPLHRDSSLLESTFTALLRVSSGFARSRPTLIPLFPTLTDFPSPSSLQSTLAKNTGVGSLHHRPSHYSNARKHMFPVPMFPTTRGAIVLIKTSLPAVAVFSMPQSRRTIAFPGLLINTIPRAI